MKKYILIISILMMACNSKSKNSSSVVKVIFLGDSITEAASSERGETGEYQGFITHIKNKVGDTIQLLNKGISGNRIPDLLKRYKEDVVNEQPDLVFIYIGINDVWHKYDFNNGTDIQLYDQGYRQIVTDLKKIKSRVVLCTPTLIGENVVFNDSIKAAMDAELDEYSEVVRNISKDLNVELLDLRTIFKNYVLNNNPNNLPKGILTYDGVHLNDQGNKLISDHMIMFIH